MNIAASQLLSRLGRICLWLVVVLLAGCMETGADSAYMPEYVDAPSQTGPGERYVFGVHPLHNPARLFEVYGPIVDLLNQRIPGAHFTLEASRNYAEYERKLYAGYYDLALPNPYQTLTALGSGYKVFGKMADDEAFRGVILVRRSSAIEEVSDLKGQAVSFPAPTALAAAMMPQAFLHRHGLPPKDYEAKYVGSQESSIMNAVTGDTAAAVTWPPPWEAFQKTHPEQAATLRVQWETPPLVNNGLVARADFPPDMLAQVGAVLFSLHESEQGRALLARLPLNRFEPASDAAYAPVRTFLTEFDRDVRALAELPQ